MKSLIKKISIAAMLLVAIACEDYYAKTNIPDFAKGASLFVTPSPWTSRPFLSVASPGTAVNLDVMSYNADELDKVDVYVSYLDNLTIAGVTGTATVADWVAPVTTGGMLLPNGTNPRYIPESGTAPVTLSYARYDQLLKGVTTTTPAVTFTAVPKFLLTTLTAGAIEGTLTVTLAQLQTLTGKTVVAGTGAGQTNNPTFAPGPNNLSKQPVFLLTFEVTRKDGGVFSYANAGPGIVSNPATGKVVTHNWTDPLSGNVNRPYNVIETGTEGSPFIPGVALRVAP